MTLPVKNVARRPVDLEGGRVLAHREQGDAPDTDHTRALLDAGLLVRLEPAPEPPKLADLTVRDLREKATGLGIDVPANAVKANLVQLIEDHDKEETGDAVS